MKPSWLPSLNPFKKKMSYNISLQLWTEKKKGLGEDAPPLLIDKGLTCAVGVFDGMGGAGATKCKSAFGEDCTKAYVASRIVAESMQVYLDTHLTTDDISAEELIAIIRNRLSKEQEMFPAEAKSLLRSKLVREYPTTMAIVTLIEHDNTRRIDSYWAGDSHCYLWTQEGISQISVDDLEQDNDPMENLHNDSPISNCICVERDFRINHIQIPLPKEPVIILTATDGCFGYYQTPMHFDYILNFTLQKAKDENDWEQLLRSEFLKVTGDDCSLSLIAVGYDSFEQLKKSMKSCPIAGFSKIVEQEETIAWTREQLERAEKQYQCDIAEGWNAYKTSYMKYINSEKDGNA